MVYIFIMLIMQLISTINWLQRIWIYRYIYFSWIDIHCWAPICIVFTCCTYFLYEQSTQLKHFERQYFSSWHNIIGVGIGIIYQTKPPLWYKTPHRWFKEGTLSGYRQNIKEVYFDLKSRCKEIKDHNFLPFLQLYDFA